MSSYYVLPPPPSPLGAVIPSGTPHAVSVSLPQWQDNVDYEEGHPRIKLAMTSGYPRFYIHHQIDQLAQLITKKFGTATESCILLPSLITATACQTFLTSQSPHPISSHLIHYPIRSTISPSSESTSNSTTTTPTTNRIIDIHACFFETKDFSVAKQFWQHTGDGISSRVAERCLILLGELDQDGNSINSITMSPSTSLNPSPIHSTSISHSNTPEPILSNKSTSARYGAKNPHFHSTKPNVIAVNTVLESSTVPNSSKSRYSTRTRNPSIPSEVSSEPSTPLSASIELEPSSSTTSTSGKSIGSSNGNGIAANGTELQEEDVLTRYVEERYGRNLDLSLAPLAKLAMRRRIAGVLGSSGVEGNSDLINNVGGHHLTEGSTRGVEGLSEKDVWLYPCGMSAIWHAHQLVLGARIKEGGQVGKSVCFGFPYTDTLKILEKWGPGCEFFGHGLLSDLPALRTLLSTSSPPILAIFCEFPSNPLLRTPPLRELRTLADEFGAMILIDETIAGFVNVEVLPLADVVVSSLTKVFSGDSNVMGGSLVINPQSSHYAALESVQSTVFEDVYFDEDAIYMERNSRDFQQRIVRENFNAETLCSLLQAYRVPGPVANGMKELKNEVYFKISSTAVIKEIYYPKYMTPDNYTSCLRPSTATSTPGFGGLFSLTFTSILASQTFFDHLPCYKGPSLGTNFTIACPYTILAHYEETDWALGWGVEKGLVRVSVGLEDPEVLKEWFLTAIGFAERAVAEEEERKKGGVN